MTDQLMPNGPFPVRSSRVDAAFGEGQRERGAEDHYHDRDKAAIGDRDGED
jgi:hypothetical protein